jgi:hypothetical protein
MMVKALRGALDYVINDIQPEGQKDVDFFALLPEFGEAVKGILMEDL